MFASRYEPDWEDGNASKLIPPRNSQRCLSSRRDRRFRLRRRASRGGISVPSSRITVSSRPPRSDILRPVGGSKRDGEQAVVAAGRATGDRPRGEAADAVREEPLLRGEPFENRESLAPNPQPLPPSRERLDGGRGVRGDASPLPKRRAAAWERGPGVRAGERAPHQLHVSGSAPAGRRIVQAGHSFHGERGRQADLRVLARLDAPQVQPFDDHDFARRAEPGASRRCQSETGRWRGSRCRCRPAARSTRNRAAVLGDRSVVLEKRLFVELSGVDVALENHPATRVRKVQSLEELRHDWADSRVVDDVRGAEHSPQVDIVNKAAAGDEVTAASRGASLCGTRSRGRIPGASEPSANDFTIVHLRRFVARPDRKALAERRRDIENRHAASFSHGRVRLSA